MIKKFSIAVLVFWSFAIWAQPLKMEANVSKIIAPIQPTMYGIFFEDINFAADGGLYPELVKNRSFEFEAPMLGWSEPSTDRFSLNLQSGNSSIMKSNTDQGVKNFLRVTVHNDQNYKILNDGFRGMGLKAGEAYRVSITADNSDGGIKNIIFTILDENEKSIGKQSVEVKGPWKAYQTSITPNKTTAKGKLQITFEGKGKIDLDMISLYPTVNWKNRTNGLRKDLVQLLYDLKPGFLRFPGGCIVEGRTLAQRYQWKKTVGPIDERKTLINRWNTEFAHKQTPDYFQSFGLGFFEYFQLAEDIGASPLPILSCGMACQFNTGELVPIDEMDPYIQDALDLIAFANDDVSTPWGKVRAEMGHPEPFNLKFIGIGNEQWGPDYFERYFLFEKAILEKYPNISIVSGSGPFPDGEEFEYGMKQLKNSKATLNDEHYYKPPVWFRENANRYDQYDRSAPKIFAGEYAAQSVATVSPENKNNWECALSEAAFMTGLERNADVVHMTSYAPLMAHTEAWQWTPDLIWFDNLSAYGTTNYYVQKMFSNHAGTDLLKITEANAPLIGQKDIYASLVKDSKLNKLYLKVVNTSKNSKPFQVDFTGAELLKNGTGMLLQSDDLQALNSIEKPQFISPKPFSFEMSKSKLEATIPAQALCIYTINLK
ncbi:MAG: carbohydrate binding domain-containing protein [Saprospiraceae bacterium]|nr:carbohydrate binding domain-containing protein [Saprospiraceae bacterium]